MKANEFVENKGLKAAKLIVDCWIDYPETDVYLPDMMEYTFIAIEPTENCPFVSLNDLKRLVESHELVEHAGGLDSAKKQIELKDSEDNCLWFVDLKIAIADVESCMEVKSEN
ncbi:hypothetical protein [Acinetobacter lwoffii]|uniref:hypothetical protein n=1 Tax=Acinetobacter lwoffii TaxID=28090 RepID=UPI00209AB267|nr:hypothetical protein [Acinetobacter lwoffii]MCO8092683.1 hypothetical protein [Acinetobacter lwoffii]